MGSISFSFRHEARMSKRLDPMLEVPMPPDLSTLGLSGATLIVAQSIKDSLDAISSACRTLIADAVLFDEASSRFDLRDNTTQGLGAVHEQWKSIACRDGAMAIRNFKTALSPIRGLVGRVPSWKDEIDADKLKKLNKYFDEQFPFARQMRNAVAHPEYYTNPEKVKPVTSGIENSEFRIDAGINVISSGNIINRRFSATYEGVLVEYTLDRETVIKLIEIAKDVYSAFASVPTRHSRWFEGAGLAFPSRDSSS